MAHGQQLNVKMIERLSGQIIARSATPGQIVVADAKLYRVTSLSTVSF